MFNTDRIRTTHVGSLARPEKLQAFLRAKENGEDYDEDAFAQCLRDSVAEVVAEQTRVGIDIVSDGEFGKTWTWAWYVRDRLDGFEERAFAPTDVVGPKDPSRMGYDRTRFADFYADYYARNPIAEGVRERGEAVCVGPISYSGQAALARDIEDIKAAMAQSGTSEGFLPVVAPSSAVPIRVDEHYQSEEEFVFALADALNVEYRTITDAGLTIQVDDAYMATMYDTLVPPGTMADFREWAELRVAALQRSLAGVPRELTRYHVCWGSWNGPHSNDVALRDILDLILRVPVGGYSLEQANPRHEHEWEVWRDVELPDDQLLLPGLISHSTNVVEHPELVCQRIVRLAKLVGRERVIASTDCGFAQTPYLTRVHPSLIWAKLESLVEGARLASAALWPGARD
ncbi:MAG TPA: cobalamin-independent methionine synthase II family protein [Solirubrobacteraceae bacterium]|nr:cobalamin-independent methionine synthase II family protein [Solirubrobacteraceae bacterium]